MAALAQGVDDRAASGSRLPDVAGQPLGAQERFDSAGRLLIEVEAALEVRVAAGISSVPKSEISRLRSGGGILGRYKPLTAFCTAVPLADTDVGDGACIPTR